MVVTLPEAVSSEIALSGVYEPALTILLIQILEPGSVFFDVGAHRGYFTLLASRLVGASGQVHAFEPTPGTFQMLQENTSHLPQVKLNQNAVYRENTTLTLHDYGIEAPAFNSIYSPRLTAAQQASVKCQDIQVSAVSLDHYVRETGVRPDFIKIDAESAEADILEGMRNLIRSARPAFTLETGDMADDKIGATRKLVDFACSLGYVPIDIAEGTMKIHQPAARYNYGNLLFIAEEKARGGRQN